MNPPALAQLPPGVRYDGVQPAAHDGGEPWLQFTDLAPGPAHGATFYVPAREAGAAGIARAVARKRAEFRAATQPLPPAVQRRPRQFCAPEINHY